jgi:dihydrofolate synthase/folylpolyglutamate synthase
MNLKTLVAWQDYIASIHSFSIELGLARVGEVARRLNLLTPKCPVITVAGTNGKGSTVAGLEAVYMAAGYKVGAFTSPYLFRLNEEVRIQGVEIDNAGLCAAFAKVEAARGETTLTTFEFNTLAALEIFYAANLDVILLEVGLGGRLDAVNIIDPDVAVVTSIAIDHADRLGNTRELIGREKAGIFRAQIPVVCGDFSPPDSLLKFADTLNAPLFQQGKNFKFTSGAANWHWQSEKNNFENLPIPSLALQNMSTVLMTIEILQEKLPVERNAIDYAFTEVKLPARIQIFPGCVTRIFDVSHNPAAAEFLVEKLKTLPCEGKTRAVFSMLADKDIVGTIDIMKKIIDGWYVAELPVERGISMEILLEKFRKAKVKEVQSHHDIVQAYQAATDDSTAGDRVIVFGSFYVVSGVIQQLL